MGKRRRQDDGPRLFVEQEIAAERRHQRQRALFIPRFLTNAAAAAMLDEAAHKATYGAIKRWADLEANGHLRHKETAIDTQFLEQIFADGLGYQVVTRSPEAWQLAHKYSVLEVGIADGALGDFPRSPVPTAVIELKGSSVNLDRDKFNGRTAVQQCWDYLNAIPGCPWGIVSNFTQIRLYHRDAGRLSYEVFTLQELKQDPDRFREFFYVFERGGLMPSRLGQVSRAVELYKRTLDRQKEVGDDLYNSYQHQRLELIQFLKAERGMELDHAIATAQKLLDRIIFIAFCEDRELLRPKCINRAATMPESAFGQKNPRWRQFLGLFREVDAGGELAGVDRGYNGGLFAPDPAIDGLDLTDIPWTEGFNTIGKFDFSEEVNVEVLGHLFERSITELEKLRVGGLFALRSAVEEANGNGAPSTRPSSRRRVPAKRAQAAEEPPESRMPKSAQRKRFGIYYTPPKFTELIVNRTIDALVAERFAALAAKHNVNPDARENGNNAKLAKYWRACLADLKALTVCDPACGSGAFLVRAYDSLDAHYKSVANGLGGAGAPKAEVDELEDAIPDLILNHNLHGVDLSKEAVEITQLALWIRSARKNRTLQDLSRHIIHGNSLVSDPAVDPDALDWNKAFAHIFGKGGPGGFSCVIGNPPWERVKLQNREFFSITAPNVIDTHNAATMRKGIAALERTNPELYASYNEALINADQLSDYARQGGRYPLTGKGDINLYMLFAELAHSLVEPDGLVGLLVPSGIATDEPTKDFFNDLMESRRLVSLHDFENKLGHFQDVHRAFKFTALVFGGSKRKQSTADFVFFARTVEDTYQANKHRHIPLTAAAITRVNPNSKTCPIFRTRRDADLTIGIYERIPVLVDRTRRTGGSSWGVRLSTALHQSADAGLFVEASKGNSIAKKGGKAAKRLLRVYEAKMVQAYDHRAASVRIEGSNWARKGQKTETVAVQHQNPEFLAEPRWWVREDDVIKAVRGPRETGFLAYKDITSPTNTRTLIASRIPWCGPTHHLALIETDQGLRLELCLLGCLNSYVLDYVVRQKLGGTTLTFFILEQLPVLPPVTFADKCPWSRRETLEHWISERVLRLSCTAEDMIPLANACGFKGSRGDGVHIWREQERAQLRDDLDAAFFLLYGVDREDAEYILSTFTNTGYIKPEDRGPDGRAWTAGGTGAGILAAYDHLKGIA